MFNGRGYRRPQPSHYPARHLSGHRRRAATNGYQIIQLPKVGDPTPSVTPADTATPAAGTTTATSASGILDTLKSSLSGLPTWAIWGGAAVLAYMLFFKKR